MNNAFYKDVFREIKNTFGRFMAIFAIVALGVAFYTGIGATGIDMKITGDLYFDRQNLMDIRIVSTYGLNDNDIAAIRNTDMIEAVYPAYNIDALVEHNSNIQLLKVFSIDTAQLNDSVNKPRLISGRLPQKENEAVTESYFLRELGYKLGDTFTLESGKKTDLRNRLKNVNYTIVGIVDSPYFISEERGSCSIGDGSVNCFLYIPQQNFRQTVYSEAFVTVKNTRNLLSFGQAYKDKIDSVIDSLELVGDYRSIERYREITNSSYDKLNQTDKTLKNTKTDAETMFTEGESAVADAEKEIRQINRDLILQYSEILSGSVDIRIAEARVQSGLKAIQDSLNILSAEENALVDNLNALDTALTDLNKQSITLQEQETLLSALYANEPDVLKYALSDIAAAKQEISIGKNELADNINQINSGFETVAAAKKTLEVQKSQLEQSLKDILREKNMISSDSAALSGGYIDTYSGLLELERQLKELSDSSIISDRQLKAAFDQVQASRDALSDLDMPEWYVFSRDSNLGYSTFSEDSDKIDAISKVFPLIFFIVAALVSLTSMTRLVEERRIEIGTLKSLGYGNFKIMSKYIIYAMFPTALGSVAGGIIGMQLFPKVIINAYNMLYNTPQPETPLHFNYWTIGTLMGVVSTVGATILACINELKSMPAALMRPKPPKHGQKIIFEKISFLWRSFSFIQKVTIRNIVRYKKRFFMTVIGIAGCTALLMTGFGIRDSIAAMMSNQYGELNLYDLTTAFNDSVKANEIKAVNDLYAQSNVSKQTLMLRQKVYDAANETGKTMSVNLIVPEDMDQFKKFTILRDRVTHDEVNMDDNGVVISEKLAILLGVTPGDSFVIKDDDSVQIELTVNGVTENYFTHYIYMSNRYYETIFHEPAAYNVIYTILNGSTSVGSARDRLIAFTNTAEASGIRLPQEDPVQALVKKVLDKKAVNSVIFTSAIINTFNNVVDGLNIVVFVLIVSAGALAFVVLLNLTSINISERIRELATIEVLGFYDREVSAYVYRENAVLTVIGAALGLLLGLLLHRYVVITAETDVMMFGRQIESMSYIYSISLTIFFSVCVNILTGRKLRKINMVEALKSIE